MLRATFFLLYLAGSAIIMASLCGVLGNAPHWEYVELTCIGSILCLLGAWIWLRAHSSS